MHLSALIGASALLLAAVDAAPKTNRFSQADARRGSQGFRPIFGRALNLTAHQLNFTNSSASSTTPQPKTETVVLWNDYAPSTIECPTASVLMSTTTVDVTVYVTATSNMSYTTPGHRAGSAPLTKLAPLYSNASTDHDTKTASVNREYKIAAIAKEYRVTETPCTDKPLLPTNGTSTRPIPTPVTRVQTQNYATIEPYFRANKTSTSLRTPDYKFQSTTLSSHTPYTTPCNKTSTPKPTVTYTPSAGNFSTPHAKVVPTTTPCEDTTTSWTPTGHSSTIYTLPFANATTPRIKLVSSSYPTPTGLPSIAYARPAAKVTPHIKAKAKASSTPSISNTTTATASLSRVSVLPYGNTTTPSASSTRITSMTFSVTPFLSTTATPTTTATSETCIIDTAIAPVSTAAFNYTRTYTPAPKTTLYENTVTNGSPRRNAAYCGVHGKPAGTYFLAQYTKQRSGVAVSLEGCYQFCNSTTAATRGCQAYRYYRDEFGAPCCDLYGMPISRSVYDLDATQPSVWYDLACGSPSAESLRSGNGADSDTTTGTGSTGGLINIDINP